MKAYKLYTLGAALILLLSNILLSMGLYGGHGVSDRSFGDAAIVPAGYAFSIWGIIYLGLYGYSVYQLFTHREEECLRKSAPYIAINMLANAAWLPCAAYDFISATVIIIALMLFTLFKINQIWDFRRAYSKWQDRFMIKYTFTIYFAWVTVATALNVTIWLKHGLGIAPVLLGEEGWSAIVLVVAFLIASYTFIKMGTRAYGTIIVWAYVAIYVSTKAPYPTLAYLAASLAGLMLLLLADRTIRKERSFGYKFSS